MRDRRTGARRARTTVDWRTEASRSRCTARAVSGSGELPALERTVASNDAIDFIIDTVRSTDDVWLVPIGPLTNIAVALRKAPDIAARLAGISFMGGSAAKAET
ncbi:MAG: nucleoside hydrolase [Acidimicrobiales bacterium]